MPKHGDTISLRAWSGKPYRSKQTILRTSIISEINLITIDADGLTIYDPVSGAGHAPCEKCFAKSDGFESWQEMREWFSATHGLPFEGIVIHWRDSP